MSVWQILYLLSEQINDLTRGLRQGQGLAEQLSLLRLSSGPPVLSPLSPMSWSSSLSPQCCHSQVTPEAYWMSMTKILLTRKVLLKK